MENSGFQDAAIVGFRVHKNGNRRANEVLTLETRSMIFDHLGNVVNIPLAHISFVASAQYSQVNTGSAVVARI